MSFLDHIRACNRRDLSRYRPFLVAERQVGWVGHDLAAQLARFSDIMIVTAETVSLSPALAEAEARGQAMAHMIDSLAADGVLRPRRGEEYPVAERWGGELLMRLDRAAVPSFGIRAYGIHVNGFVRGADGLALWIGRRAADKDVAPGKLDNMIAGGQPAGLSLAENLRKEAAEEAGVDAALADRAVPVGAIGYCLENHAGIKPDTMFCYDLELPAGFVPRNTDGEIAAFTLMPVAEVARLVRGTDEFKFNVNLVITDFLVRHGLLSPDHEPDYLDIVLGLRQPM